MDWTGGALASAGIVLRPADPVLEVGGTVGLALGGVVLASATVRMSQSVVEEVRNPNGGEANVRMRGSLLALELADARVFVGSGGELVRDTGRADFGTAILPSTGDPAAVGFAVEGVALRMAVLSATEWAAEVGAYSTMGAPRRYVGLQASLGRAQLQGIDSVRLITRSLSAELNQSNVGGRLDWTQGVPDGATGSNPLALAKLSLTTASNDLRVGGSVGLAIADVVFGSASLELTRGGSQRGG